MSHASTTADSHHRPAPPNAPETPDTPQTVLGEGARVHGDLHLDHGAVLAGTVAGSVHVAGYLELTASAVVKGDVHAESLKLAGRVIGNVTASQTTQLLPGGRIDGSLDTAQLVAAPGATYEGQLRLHRPAAAGSHAGHSSGSQTAATKDHADGPAIQLNRAAGQAKNSADAHPFADVPGAVNAALRPRHRYQTHRTTA